MISPIIPTYNEEENIENCLKNVLSQTLPRSEYEIIVVDGGSKDRTQEIAGKYADRVVLQKHRGVGGARNDGVNAANGDIIASTDADVQLPPDWLERVRNYFEDSDVGGVCGPNLPVEPYIRARVAYFFINIVHTASAKVGLIGMPGNNTAFRKKEFLGIGGYSEELSYMDDIDMGLRLRKKGRIIYDRHMAVKVSVRRMHEDGYLKTMLLWLKGDIRLLLGRNPGEVKYFRKEE